MRFRKKRLEVLFRDEIAQILEKILDFSKTGLVTITKVELTSDLRNCKIFYSPFDDTKIDYMKNFFKKRGGYLKGILSKKVYIKYMPEVEFIYDDSPRKVSEVFSIMDGLKENNKV